MLEAIAELAFELLLEIGLELLAELGIHSLAAPFQRRPNRGFALFGYLLLGLIAGGLSLLFVPQHFIRTNAWQWINLGATPVLVGVSSLAIGRWRSVEKMPGDAVWRFANGFLFALAIAAVRMIWAR